MHTHTHILIEIEINIFASQVAWIFLSSTGGQKFEVNPPDTAAEHWTCGSWFQDLKNLETIIWFIQLTYIRRRRSLLLLFDTIYKSKIQPVK